MNYEIMKAEHVGVGDSVIFGNDPFEVLAVDARSNVGAVVVVIDGKGAMRVERGTRFAVVPAMT